MIVGNWKMHGLMAQLAEIRALAEAVKGAPRPGRVVVCPPATLLADARRILKDSSIELGGQDCHDQDKGPFTGDISAEMLADAGAALVILGHSERREGHGETDGIVAAKVKAAVRAGLEPIICVGEQLESRRAGNAVATVTSQLDGSLPPELASRRFHIAYEPVWAIGSGLTPSRDEIAQMHEAIRGSLEARFGSEGSRVAILYGGSVKAGNSAEVLTTPGVDGALVGGASLIAADFLKIIQSR